MITFNPTIDLGSIIAAVVVIGGGMAFAKVVEWRLKVIERNLEAQATKLDTFGNVLMQLATQDVRIKHLESGFEDLRHGRGFTLENTFAGAFPPNKDK